jgi:hypothetical protein
MHYSISKEIEQIQMQEQKRMRVISRTRHQKSQKKMTASTTPYITVTRITNVANLERERSKFLKVSEPVNS